MTVSAAALIAVSAAAIAAPYAFAESDLAVLERHRPVLAYDREEKWRAVAVDGFIADGLPPQLSDTPTPSGADDIVYGRVARDGSQTWLQYWLFFAYNGQDRGIVRTGRHEGDWELFQLRLGAGGAADAATFSQHSSEAACSGDQLGPGRTRVYVANGSHALYPRSGVHDRPFPDPNDVARGYRTALPTVRVVTASSPSWIRWDGRWGGSRAGLIPDEESSPRGPLHAGERWSEPAKVHDEARSCHSTPTSAWSVAPWVVAGVAAGLALVALRRRRRRA